MSTRLQALLVILVAFVLAYLQADNLAHILTDSDPFKEMWFPPAELYVSCAGVIRWLVPITAAATALACARGRTKPAAAVLGAVAGPVCAWLIVAVQSFSVAAPRGYINEAPDFSRPGALRDFAFWCIFAAVLGGMLASPTVLLQLWLARRAPPN
ncbi:MAG: hypothetical protein ACJ76N_25155 [Thermoanaerobaculia bacterium]